MKSGKFRKVEFTIELTSSYGRYIIKSHYRGRDIKIATTDAELYDWIDDTSNKEKNHWALKSIYNYIVSAYESRNYIMLWK